MSKVNEDNIIETIDEDGEVIKFELFDVIEFEEKEYALLLPVGVEVDEDSDESEMVLMRLVKMVKIILLKQLMMKKNLKEFQIILNQ